MERSYGKSFARLWKILEYQSVLFPPFIAYETVEEFETFVKSQVASQPSLHVRDETMKRSFFVSLPSATFTILIPSCHLCYHIYAHGQSFTSMWKFSYFSLFLLMFLKRLM